MTGLLERDNVAKRSGSGAGTGEDCCEFTAVDSDASDHEELGSRVSGSALLVEVSISRTGAGWRMRIKKHDSTRICSVV